MTLVWLCDTCHEPIGNGDGWLTVDVTAAIEAQRAHKAFDDEHRGQVVCASELLELPDDASWRCYHRGCDPDPREHAGRAYWFAVERARTLAQLLDWSLHLSEKAWFTSTDWVSFVYRRVPGVAWAS